MKKKKEKKPQEIAFVKKLYRTGRKKYYNSWKKSDIYQTNIS